MPALTLREVLALDPVRATEPELLSTALEASVTALAKGRRNGRRRSSGPLRSRPHERADRVLERAGGAELKYLP